MAVTIDQVKAIYPDISSLSDEQIQVFIDIGVGFVDPLLLNKGLTQLFIDTVTLYVIAHFLVLSMENGGLRRQRLGDADESYKTPGDFDLGLRQTRFGQMAMILDSTGTLAAVGANSGLKAQFEVI